MPRSSLSRRGFLTAMSLSAPLLSSRLAPGTASVASLLMFGCAPSAPKVASVPEAPAGLHLSPLSDLAPAGGLRWIVLARAGELVQPAALGRPLAEILAVERLEALAELLGFDARLADDVVVADYGTSTLFLFRVAHDPEIVERRFRERIPGEIVRVVHEPRIVRVTGAVGRSVRSLVLLDGHVVALEIGGESYARAAVGFAREKLRRAKPALETEPLASLVRGLREHADPPLLLLAPNPAADPWTKGAHGLLQVTTAVGMAATPKDGALSVELRATGQYGDSLEPVRERLEATVKDLVTSPLGSLTGLREPLSDYAYEVGPERLQVRCTWDALRLAGGLRAATAASLAEIFRKLPRSAQLPSGGVEEGVFPPGDPDERRLDVPANPR